MDTPTFLEVEVERDAVASVLDAVPGIAVAEDDHADPVPAVAMDPDGANSSAGLTARLRSFWQQWGLLGTGVSLIALGAATAGFWWYRRRGDDADDDDGDDYTTAWDADSAVETPAQSESTADTPSPTASTIDSPAPTDPDTESTTPDESDSEPPSETQDTELASESTAQWAAARDRDTDLDPEQPGTAGTAQTTRDQPAPSESENGELNARPAAKIDPAPLLGAAFLIVTGAIGRWVTRERDDDT